MNCSMSHWIECEVAKVCPNGRTLNIALGWGVDSGLAAVLVDKGGEYVAWSFNADGADLFAGRYSQDFETAFAAFERKRVNIQRGVLNYAKA